MTNAQATLAAEVMRFIAALRSANNQTISAPFVAASILRDFPHSSIFTPVESTAAYMGIAQVARAALRGQHDREYDPNQIAQGSLDLPESSLLNGGYSVLRPSADLTEKEREPIYVPRDSMTREDMEYVCAKFDALSAHFARHSRALRADFERRQFATI